jgi:tRNA pseudouridine synthase 9
MALTVVEEAVSAPETPEIFLPPPAVVTTPCDPWPRPYYFEDGLRKVLPYHYTYNTYCKERWRGKELLSVFVTEFRDRPVEYYVNPPFYAFLSTSTDTLQQDAIERGKVVINGKPVPSIHSIVKNGDVVSHTLHRHEPPVTAQPIGIVHEDNDMIVINKPAGVPVHPAGRYNYNSVVEIMRAERGHQWNPLPCNRLDRLTSGVMFIGKNAVAADKLSVQIQDRAVKKEYIARVIGEFPLGDVLCEQPIMQISPKLGLNRARASGKDARTVFKRLAYYPPRRRNRDTSPTVEDKRTEQEKARDSHKPWKAKGGYSIVRCLPLTGRTHQLRVHLQYLGHPIANDPIYCNQRVFGPSLAAGDASADKDEDIISRLSRMGKSEVAEAMAYHDEMMEEYNKKKAEKMTGELCDVCHTPLYSDPGLHELGIYLHAKRYACDSGGWAYETGLPEWALPPKGMEGPVEVTEEEEEDLVGLAEKVEGLDVGEKGREEAGMKESGDVVNRREIGESGYVEPAKALWVMPG